MKHVLPVITALLIAAQAAFCAEESAAGHLPAFRYHGVVLEAANLKYRPHDDVIFPSVVRLEGRMPKPLGKLYLYYASHDAPGGICLAYADRPEGPWQEYARNPVISRTWEPHYSVSHVSGPDAIWNEEEGKLFLYFHGGNSLTRLATSGDGIHFDYADEVVSTRMFSGLSEVSYGRVFRHSLPGRDNRYIMLLMGNDHGTRRIYLAWSRDGRKWETRPEALMDPPPGTDQIAGAVLLSWGGKFHLIAHANNSKAAFNEGYDLYVAGTDAALENVRPPGKFFGRTSVSPTNPGVMSPCFIEDDGRLCMFFNIGARLRNKIALAIAEPGAPPAAGAPAVLPLWPAGKMPGTGAAALEMEAPSKGDGVIRLTNVSEPDLTVFRAPAAKAPAPAVIICPGGGYRILAINKEGSEVAAWLNTLGITGIVLKYRVPDNRQGALQDIQRAVRLTRARHKEWNIDAARVGVMGFSAGGHLCARLGATHGTSSYPPLDGVDRMNDRPDFAVLVYPAYLGENGRPAREVTVSGKVPPSFIAHSEDDENHVPGSRLYVEALAAARVPHESALYPTGGHGYGLHSVKAARAWPDRCAAWLKTIRVLPHDR